MISNISIYYNFQFPETLEMKLSRALQTRDIALARYLVQLGQAISLTYEDFYAALYLNDFDLVTDFLQHPTIRQQVANKGNLALFTAVALGNLDIVKCLLQYPDVFNSLTDFHNEILIVAVCNRHYSITAYLLTFPAVRANILHNDVEALKTARQVNAHDIEALILSLDIVQNYLQSRESLLAFQWSLASQRPSPFAELDDRGLYGNGVNYDSEMQDVTSTPKRSFDSAADEHEARPNKRRNLHVFE